MSTTTTATDTAAPARQGPRLDNSNRVKKLTVERICGKLAPATEGADPRWHCDVYAYVTGNKLETSPYGDYYRWLGEFRSLNLETGEVLVAANAIFPGIASDLVEAAYAGGNNIGGEARNVMLAFRIGTTHDKNKAGYKYVLRDIVRADYRSPIVMLYQETQVPLQIEHEAAPSPASEPAPAKEADKQEGESSAKPKATAKH